MAGPSGAFLKHLQSGTTSVCRCWGLTRVDGMRYGFTDHDCTLAFAGWSFKAGTGLTARALAQATGLSVDNSEAQGALSDLSLTESDIVAGRFDGASLQCWLVNWQNPVERWLQFSGSIGELRRAGGAFEAELRGQTEPLNRPLGRIYQKSCTAVLGDASCGFDLQRLGYFFEGQVETYSDEGQFTWNALEGFEAEWFSGGRLSVLSGEAKGLWGAIKRDRTDSTGRHITLWEPLKVPLQPGDLLRLDAGCDKRPQSCRLKFNNFINFQGFPDIPGEDWMMAVPKSTGRNSGGSRR
ncbi:hypothetical protein RSK20926_20565 [Roseobacter sp. SK209-2-6]|uniref:DUF2163 domain-containing protein n=1 Tax=Roseobacter sp. SK209-2-6 TaxID=388739 RepID=UPI0000F3E73B|nr:DUF2163 domain-containing protein [Roseobacter sp. SK209-2-6]EBA16157.1 hypothetical protein RSK20926_20565 [Roseobacter sp. SK209-2-6]